MFFSYTSLKFPENGQINTCSYLFAQLFGVPRLYTFSLFRRNQGGTATNISENESLSIDLEEFFDVLKLGLEHSGAVREDIVGKEVGVLKEFQTDLIQMHKEFIENDYNYSSFGVESLLFGSKWPNSSADV